MERGDQKNVDYFRVLLNMLGFDVAFKLKNFLFLLFEIFYI